MSNDIELEPSVKQESTLSKVLKIVIPLVIGVVVLWFLYRDTDFNKMWETIKDANFGILALSLIFGPLGNIIRGFRWKLLIEPLGYNPSVKTLIYSVLGSYAVNIAIPRGGEVWRCAIVAKQEKIPFSKLIGTMLLDRLSDTATVIAIILLACCFNLNVFVSYIENNQAILEMLNKFISSPWLIGGLILLIIFLVLVFTVFKNNKIVRKVINFLNDIWNDMKTIFKMKHKGQFLLYTLGIWVCYFLYFYITFFAFDFTRHLGITAGLIGFALSSLSMAIPTNGGMGVWHAAVVLSLGLYGVSKDSAEAFAFAVFAIQSLWIVICGLYSMFAISLNDTKK